MRDTNARTLRIITLVLGLVMLACPLLAQEPDASAIWPMYHYDAYHSGQNPNSTDIKGTDNTAVDPNAHGPGTLNLIWVYPRADDSSAPTGTPTIVDDSTVPGFSTSGVWQPGPLPTDPPLTDAYNGRYQYADAEGATATWAVPSSLPPGKYQISVSLPYIPPVTSVPYVPVATTAATYTVYDDSGPHTFTLDQNIPSSTGVVTWKQLSTDTFDTFTFTGAIADERVELEVAVGNTKIVIADAVEFTPATVVDDDTNIPGFSITGAWRPDTLTDAYNGAYHYARVVTTSNGAPTATWAWPTGLPGGKYQIFVWVPPVTVASPYTGVTADAVYTVTDDSGGHPFTLDQTNGSGWILLSTNYFTFTGANANEGVVLTAFVAGGRGADIVIADAVKFTPALVETGEQTGEQIYSSPASADIPVTLPPEDPGKGSLWNNELATCVFVGTVKPADTVKPPINLHYIVDDPDATLLSPAPWGIELAGNASLPGSVPAYGGSYQVTGVVNDPNQTNIPTARWAFPNLPKGKYLVYVWLPYIKDTTGTTKATDGTTAATYTVTDQNGAHRIQFDQSRGESWGLLTSTPFSFSNQGSQGVELTALVEAAGATGSNVIADAIRYDWVPESVDKGAIYCIYGITPTINNPALSDGTPNPSIDNSVRDVAISKYLGKHKWRYPLDGADVNNREETEGPIQGGIYSSPTLAQVNVALGINRLTCFVAGMDRQVYALDAETGRPLWGGRGLGVTVPEQHGAYNKGAWNRLDTREDAFGGDFIYTMCSASSTIKDSTASILWTVTGVTANMVYDVYVWLPSPEIGDDQNIGDYPRSKTATYEIKYGLADTPAVEVKVDQSDPKYWGTWVLLGSYANVSAVTLGNTAVEYKDGSNPTVPAESQYVVADVIRLVPRGVGDHTVEGLGYSSPVTDATTFTGLTSIATSVFACSVSGHVMGFNAATGVLNWITSDVTYYNPTTTQCDLTRRTGEIGASPAYRDGNLYVASLDGTIERVDTRTGAMEQIFSTGRPSDESDQNPGGFTSSPALRDNWLYIGSTGGVFYCIDSSQSCGTSVDGHGNYIYNWKYPSDDEPTTPPLGSFKYSTPAVGESSSSGAGETRVWCGSSDGHIYSFLAADGTRLHLDDNGAPINKSGPWYSEPSLLAPIQGSVALDGVSVEGNSTMYVGDMNGTLHWRDAQNGTTNDWLYAGWTTPDMLFSSPNISNTTVVGTPVSWIYVGCADGHLFAFTRGGGDGNSAWGGMWQGGEWPFSGHENSNESKTTAAPETDIQFDIFNQQFYNDTDQYLTAWLDPIDPVTKVQNDAAIAAWPNNIIVSPGMKVVPDDFAAHDATGPRIDAELTKQAKLRRQKVYMPEGRDQNNLLYFEWGEKIYIMLWNLPEAQFLYGGGSSAFTFTMTNASSGESAGSMFKFRVGTPRSYTVVTGPDGGPYTALPDPDNAGAKVRRSYVLVTVSLDGTNGAELPSPGPGWVLSVQIKKKVSSAANALVTTITLPLAKLALGTGIYSGVYVPVQVGQNRARPDDPRPFAEASIGINNPLAIQDDRGASLGWKHGVYPNRNDDDVHVNGNKIWPLTTAPPVIPAMDLGMPNITTHLPVPHGTSSREAPLGVMDRSMMGQAVPPRQITQFRINSSDLRFRNWPYAVESQISGVTYGIRFPWDGGPGSVDYPDIYRRYQTYQQISTDSDPTNTQCRMLGIEAGQLRADTVLVSADVPRFQPANIYEDASGLNGYSKTMTAYIDTNNNNSFDDGNVLYDKPTTHQDTYRTFRVGLKVPPDPKLEVEEQLIDIGSAPHGLGVKTTDKLAFSAYNPNPEIQQWFKKITIKNAGNVNLYNIRINQALGLVSDQAGLGALLPGAAITSSLDPIALPPSEPFASDPFVSTGTNADGGSVFLGYTLSKPRVGDPDPTIMTVPDRRKWDEDYDANQKAAGIIASNGWAVPPDKPEPLPVAVSVRVPLTQPIGTYQSWDFLYNIPYVAVYSDIPGAVKCLAGTLEAVPWQLGDPVAMPSFQLKATVRENQLTGGATPTTLPQIDHLPNSAVASPDLLPRVGDATPAAFRDAADDELGVHLFWSSNGSSDRTGPYPEDDAERAKLASAPWFINHAVLGYTIVPSNPADNCWSAVDNFHWWTTPGTRIPAEQWAVPSGGSLDALHIMPWSTSDGLYSVRHYSPCIGENLAVARTAKLNRTWLAWAGTADVKDSTNKISQINLIFYTDATHGVDVSTGSTRKIWAIEHDPTMVKRNPCPVPDGNNMWMFWQGGSSGNWSIYYSYSDGGPSFDTTSTTTGWSPDMKLRTPDCMASVGSPNALLRHWWANLRGKTETDFPDAYRVLLSNSKKVFDVVYSSTSKITRNADIVLSRYIAAYPDTGFPNVQPSRIAQPMPRVIDEKLMRDPKFGFYTSKHLAWMRAARGGASGTDHWGDYASDGANISPDFPYVRVVFPEGYDGVTPALAAGTAISATDGSVYGVLSVPGAAITPEIDDATGIYTYRYPAGSVADRALGQMLVDFSSGIVRFTKPLKEVQLSSGKFSSPEVHADYTPQAWRITTDSAADSSPRAFIEHTSMTGTQIDGSKVVRGLDPSWSLDKPAPVDRMWVFWRKTGTAVDSSTIFYTTMRIGVDLTKLGLPPIPMNGDGTIPPTAGLEVNNALGPWEVDRTGTKIYFSETDERYRSMITPANSAALGAPPVDMTIHYDDAKGNAQQKTLYDVSWITELPEQSLFGFAADANVNEGSIYAFADPQPIESGTSGGVLSSKIWVFWTSTRAGNSDLFWETLSPNSWAR